MRGKLPGFHYDARRGIARFEVVVPGTEGRKRVRKSIAAPDRAEALKLWKQFRDDVLAGRVHTIKTLRQYVAAYWGKFTADKKPKTAKAYTWILNVRILPVFGDMRLDRISAATVRDFGLALKQNGRSATSIQTYTQVLKALLHDAVEREEIPVYPIRGRQPQVKKDLPKLELSTEERIRFLSAFDDFERFRAVALAGIKVNWDLRAAPLYHQRFRAFKPLFVVALETGLRKSDILNLRWTSVDFRTGVVTVKTSKTGQEVTIPMSTECRAALEECRNRPIVGRNVFVTEHGKQLSASMLDVYFALAKRIAGITRRFRFHDLRHTFGSRLASAGVPLQTIAKLMGHSSIKQTERYARPDQESVKRAISALERSEMNFFLNSSGKDGKR